MGWGSWLIAVLIKKKKKKWGKRLCDCVRAVSPPAVQWWLVALRDRDRQHGQGGLRASRAVHFHM